MAFFCCCYILSYRKFFLHFLFLQTEWIYMKNSREKMKQQKNGNKANNSDRDEWWKWRKLVEIWEGEEWARWEINSEIGQWKFNEIFYASAAIEQS